MNWYLAVLKKYAEFGGRAQRAEYWYFALFNLIFSVVLGIIDGVVGLGVGPEGAIGLLGLVYALAVLIPGIAVTIRRLHDTSRSGWWLLIAFIPFIGAIVILIFMVLDSEAGENQWGPSPKA